MMLRRVFYGIETCSLWCCDQPDDAKFDMASPAGPTVDWSKAVPTLDMVAAAGKKKMTVVTDDDVLNDNFFVERINRFSMLLVVVVLMTVIIIIIIRTII